MENIKKSIFEFDSMTDSENTDANRLLENSLECILKECDSLSLQNNQDINVCIASIKSTYENQNKRKCNEILKNNNEFLLSIINSLIQQIKYN
jgi:hypothetical protein